MNCKLTDFGASRNINLLMTNMTFTKGIGTPAYMAPEILDQKKYKKSADIYSFAITMYEVFNWKQAYSTKEFKFPWKIAEFVASGNRLKRLDSMIEEQYSVIQQCWEQEPNDRLTIKEVITQLEKLN